MYNQMRNSVPNPSGPLVTPQPGAVARAIGGLGAVVEDYGLFKTAQGAHAEERTKKLDQIRKASQQTLSIAEQLNKFHDSLRTDTNLDGYDQRFSELQTKLQADVETIPDEEVRTQVQADLDDRLNTYQKDMLTFRHQARIDKFVRELPDAKARAIELGDDTPFALTLTALRENNLISAESETYQLAELRKAIVKKDERNNLLATARQMGPESWSTWVSNEANLSGLTLNTDELTEVKAQAKQYFSSQADAAAIKVRQAQLLQEANDAQLIGDFYGGKISDPSAIPDMIANQTISPTVGKTILEGLRRGPAQENDPETLWKVLDNFNAVSQGTMTQHQALQNLRASASGLKRETYDSQLAKLADYASIQNQAVSHEVTLARGEFPQATLAEKTSAQTEMDSYDYAANNPKSQYYPKYVAAKKVYDDLVAQEALNNRRWQLVSESLEKFIRDNPKATPVEIKRHALELKAQIRTYDPSQLGNRFESLQRDLLGKSGGLDMSTGGLDTSMPSRSSPAGLESIWDKLDAEGKASAVRRMNQGYTAQQLVSAWEASRGSVR